jgi:hypothetical protein
LKLKVTAMRLPAPRHFDSPTAFIAALEVLGRSVGARPLGPAAVGMLAVYGTEAEFWWAVWELLRDTPYAAGDTIEDVLARY